AEHSNRLATPIYTNHQRRRTVYQQEESPVLLEVHTINKKSVSLPQLIAAGVITALVATGWYNREVLKIVRPQQNTITQAAAPAVFQVSLPTPPKPASQAVVDTVLAKAPDTVSVAVAKPLVSAPRTKQAVTDVKEDTQATNSTVTTDVAELTTPSITKEGKKEATIDTSIAKEKTEKRETTEATVAQTANDTKVDQTTSHKKKGLGQAIKNIFKKKKKDNDRSEEEKADTQ
ncbi:MAG TPA: hypothetical protein VD794_15535, partial [Flavisolibacter sp.]|nr:hypothetical protein [Flavisolibacter sp.]